MLKTIIVAVAHLWHTIIEKGGDLGQFSLIFRQCLDGANTQFMVDFLMRAQLEW